MANTPKQERKLKKRANLMIDKALKGDITALIKILKILEG